ncbi:disulfide bond formation protein DsbA, partial [Bacillus sp. SRB_28]
MLLCISAFASAAPAPQAESSSDAQLANLLFNDPNSPRIGAKAPRLTIVSFTDYNCPYCKQFDPLLEKIVHDNPDVLLIVKLLPFKGQSSV